MLAWICNDGITWLCLLLENQKRKNPKYNINTEKNMEAWGTKSIGSRGCIKLPFYNLQNYFIYYTIPFYNTPNILIFIFPYNTIK